MNRASRAELAVSALFAGALGLGASGPVRDNSLLTHIATGRVQVTSGLPSENPFLWTSTDFPVPSWWWSAALGWIERGLGLGGVRLLTVVVAAALGWMLVRVARPSTHPGEPSGRLLALLLPPAVTVVLLVPFLNGRPHLAGFVCVALILVVWRERAAAWWLVPVFAVWVNLHGSWLYGIAVMVLLAVAEWLDTRKVCWDRWPWFAATAGGLLLGGLVYPERFRLVLLPTEQLGDESARQAMRLYREWQPPGFDSPLGWVFAIVALLGVYGALGAGGRAMGTTEDRGSLRVGSLLAVIGLAVMGLSATRLLPIAAISLSAFAAVGVERLSGMPAPSRPLRVGMGAVGCVLLALALVRTARAPHLDASPYPVEEVDWLEARGLVAQPETRVLAPDFVGNYLEFRYGEQANAWVDDRPSVETFLDYEQLRELDPGWRATLEDSAADVVLWEADEPLAGELAEDPGWSVGLTTDRFLVLCREETVGPRCA